MQSLYNHKRYPVEIARKVNLLSPLAISIANRWMLGWPDSVAALIATGEYLDALVRQEVEERRALAEPGLDHLSSWEKSEVMGLCQSPPSASQ
jgi:hypothetical protein